MYIYIYIYSIYIHTHTHIYILYIYIYIRTYMHTDTHMFLTGLPDVSAWNPGIRTRDLLLHNFGFGFHRLLVRVLKIKGFRALKI